jgi:hypothetical protein
VLSPGTDCNFRPLALPVITRILYFLFQGFRFQVPGFRFQVSGNVEPETWNLEL